MRNTLAFIGIGFLVILIGAWYAFSHIQTSPRPSDTMKPANVTMTGSMKLTSAAFQEGSSIPSEFTCDGIQKSPQLSISGVPAETKSLAIIMDDPDVPKQLKPDGVFDHWVMFNISPGTQEIPEGGSAGVVGSNGAGKNAYAGPCPPPQYEPSEHRYFFKLYALDTILPLQEGATKQDVLDAMNGHVISQTELIGKYKRK